MELEPVLPKGWQSLAFHLSWLVATSTVLCFDALDAVSHLSSSRRNASRPATDGYYLDICGAQSVVGVGKLKEPNDTFAIPSAGP